MSTSNAGTATTRLAKEYIDKALLSGVSDTKAAALANPKGAASIAVAYKTVAEHKASLAGLMRKATVPATSERQQKQAFSKTLSDITPRTKGAPPSPAATLANAVGQMIKQMKSAQIIDTQPPKGNA